MSMFAFALKKKGGAGDSGVVSPGPMSSSVTLQAASLDDKVEARSLSNDELLKLQQENSALKEALTAIQHQMQKKLPTSAAWAKTGIKGNQVTRSPPSAPSAPPQPLYPSLLDDECGANPYPSLPAASAPSLTSSSILNNDQLHELSSFYEQLKSSLDESEKTSLFPSSAPSAPTVNSAPTLKTKSSPAYPSLEEESEDGFTSVDSEGSARMDSDFSARLASAGVLNHNPIPCPTKSSVLVSSVAYDEDLEEEEQQVAVVDLENVEWWTLVNRDNDEFSLQKEEIQIEGDSEICTLDDDDGFVLLKDDDISNALAEFIVKSMQAHPEAKALTPAQVKTMIEGTIGGLREPSSVQRVWNLGRFAYQTWGWGTTAYTLYKDPTMIRLAARVAYKAATWILVLVI